MPDTTKHSSAKELNLTLLPGRGLVGPPPAFALAKPWVTRLRPALNLSPAPSFLLGEGGVRGQSLSSLKGQVGAQLRGHRSPSGAGGAGATLGSR